MTRRGFIFLTILTYCQKTKEDLVKLDADPGL